MKKLYDISCKEDFFSLFLNREWTVSIDFLNNKKWTAMPAPNTLTLIESEWLSGAIHKFSCHQYTEYTFEYDGDIFYKKHNNTQNNIFQSDFNNPDKFLIITNENLDFLYFRNQNNLYHLFCGESDFINDCLKCSNYMAEKIFRSYAINSYRADDDEHSYLQKIWTLYTKRNVK